MTSIKYIMLIAAILFLLRTRAISQISAIYAGGPVYRERSYSIDELRESGFNTVIVWTIHMEENGDLGFNGEFPLIKDGVYVGNTTHSNFIDDLNRLKAEGSSIDRIEFGLSAAGSGTYDHIRRLVTNEGVAPGSTLYQNFKVLRETFPMVDAISNDDESTYHVSSSVDFHVMLFDLGFKTAPVPYQRAGSYWKPLTDQVNELRSGAIDRVYLQVYAGGHGNDPCSVLWDFGLPVIPGVWGGGTRDTPSDVFSKIRRWHIECDIKGGFMWLYDDFDNSPQVSRFAQSIKNAFNESILSVRKTQASMSIYPNPSSSNVKIVLDQFSGNQLLLKVVDVNGREIFKEDQLNFCIRNGFMEWQADRNTTLHAGIYFIFIDTGVEIIENKVLIK